VAVLLVVLGVREIAQSQELPVAFLSEAVANFLTMFFRAFRVSKKSLDM
jgi:hypothetical protein